MKLISGAMFLLLSFGSFHAGALGLAPGYLIEWPAIPGASYYSVLSTTNASPSIDAINAKLNELGHLAKFTESVFYDVRNFVSPDTFTDWTVTNTSATNLVVWFTPGRYHYFDVYALFPSVSNSVTVAWTYTNALAQGVARYRLYWHSTIDHYTNFVETPNLRAVVTNLVPGSTYVFSATALGANGLESDYSKALLWTAPTNQLPLRIQARIRRL